MKFAATTLLLLFALTVFAQEPVLLNDFTTSGASTFDFDPEINGIVMKPTPGVDASERLFFVADDGIHGEELWRSDGTAVGTQLVKDIRPGKNNSGVSFIETVGNTVYFGASDGEHGYELWKSQGTAASTQMVVDLNEGSGSGISTGNGRHVYFNDVLYFSGSSDKGTELYCSDGTAEGTTLVKDINPNVTGSGIPFSGSPTRMTPAKDIIYFVANDGEHGNELWRTDGTAAGTVLVKDISEGANSTNFYQMKTFDNNILIFVADNEVNGRQLWISLGTAQTTYMLTNYTEGEGNSGIEILEWAQPGNPDSFLYFTVKESIRRRLWKTNGNQGTTPQLVEGFGSTGSNVRGHTLYQDTLYFVEGSSLWKAKGGTEEQVTENISVDGNNFAIYNDELYFIANQSDGNGLWKTDGTTEGTSLVREITSASFRDIDNLFVTSFASGSDRHLYFIADTDEFGRELWTSDGTAEGTFMLVDSRPGEEDGFRSFFDDVNFHDVGAQLMFAGFDEVHGRELWKSNGTTEATTLVKDINTQSEDIRLYSNPVAYQNQTYFTTDEGVWQTDGTSENTSLLQESEATFGVQVFNDQLIYTAPAPGTNRMIWTSDGTAEGSQPLLDSAEAAGLRIFFRPTQPQINGTLLFAGRTNDLGEELWKTDGTAEGTAFIKDINSGNGDGISDFDEDNYIVVNNTLYFRAFTSFQGRELWKTDGTEAGTVPVSDINPFGNSSPHNFIEIDGTIFFSAEDGTSGRELWKTDGTTDGTALVKDFFPGGEDDSGISSNVEFVDYQGTLFFAANDGEHGRELWKSDGTEAGTVMVKDIYPNTNNFRRSSHPRNLIVYNDLLVFTAADSTGRKVWRSDGTEEGTQLLIDIEANRGFINANGTLFFTATDKEHGLELWRTDGTSEGTQLVEDIFVGPNDSSPARLEYVNETLYFTALDASNGRELWALSPLRTQTALEASSTEICTPEDSLTFTATVTDAGAEPRYQWYINDQAVEGQTSTTFSANNFTDGDEVKVQVIASKDVWVLQDSIFSEAIAVSSSGLAPQISVAGNQLTATEATSYQWYLGGEAITDATSQTLTAQESGSYTVEVSNEAGCTFLSNAVSVIVCTLEAPVIQQEGDSLFVEQTGSYQWFLDGEALPDNSQRIEAAESGSYTVEVTDASGCSATSEALEVNITSIEDPRIAKQVLTFPNPARTRLSVVSQMHEAINITIYNATGHRVFENIMSPGRQQLELALGNLSPGLYLIRLQSEQGLSHRKLIKE